MNPIAANQLIIEIIIRVVTGNPADKATARQMASRLDEASLRRLKVAADEVAILAEDVFFERRRKKRGARTDE